MKKILIIIILGMFLVTLVGAVEPNYRTKYFTPVDIVETCTFVGEACDGAYNCSITIVNPNEEVVIRDGVMTKNFPTYNYTFKNTSELGDYKLHIYCTNGAFAGYDGDMILQVTTTGRTPEIKIPLFMLFISLVAFLLALYLKSHPIGFISGVLFLISGIYQMAYGFGDIANMYTQAMAYIVLAFGLFIMLIAGIEWLSEEEGY